MWRPWWSCDRTFWTNFCFPTRRLLKSGFQLVQRRRFEDADYFPYRNAFFPLRCIANIFPYKLSLMYVWFFQEKVKDQTRKIIKQTSLTSKSQVKIYFQWVFHHIWLRTILTSTFWTKLHTPNTWKPHIKSGFNWLSSIWGEVWKYWWTTSGCTTP